MHNVDILDLTILSDLNKAGHISMITGAPVTAFNNIKRAQNTIYKRLMYLKEMGYIAQGLSLKRYDTFFITPEGIKLLEEVLH